MNYRFVFFLLCKKCYGNSHSHYIKNLILLLQELEKKRKKKNTTEPKVNTRKKVTKTEEIENFKKITKKTTKL